VATVKTRHDNCTCGYEIINAPSSKPDISLPLLPSSTPLISAAVHSHLKGMLSKGGKYKNSGTNVRIFSNNFQATSGVHSALANSYLIPFNGSNFPELTSFLNLYDEARITKVVTHFLVSCETTGSYFVRQPYALSLGFDPNIGTPGSVNSMLPDKYNTGPLWVNGVLPTGGTAYDGHFHKLVATPSHNLVPITGSDCPGSSWFTINSATTPTAAVLQYYVGDLGTSGTSNISAYFELHVQFRVRT
jgi:hypothetical protein